MGRNAWRLMPFSLPPTCCVFPSPSLKGSQQVCSRSKKDKHLERQMVQFHLKTDQGTLRRTLCNHNRPVYVAGGIASGRETSLPRATMSSANYKGQKQRKPILPSIHGVIPPLMLKLLFVWYLGVKAQAMSSLVLSCRGLSIAMGEKNRDYSFSSPLGRCISLFWVFCEAATPPKCAGV